MNFPINNKKRSLNNSDNETDFGINYDSDTDYEPDKQYHMKNSYTSSKKPRRSSRDNIKYDYKYIDEELSDDEFQSEPEIDHDQCVNPNCDHIESSMICLPKRDLKTLQDLIKLGKTYHCKNNKLYYGLDLKLLYNLSIPLIKLDDLVGMVDIKANILNHILFFLQGLDKKENMLHTVITGPPGVGKTELGKILGQIYNAMGILSNGKMHIASRPDLIGDVLGRTAILTQTFINKCIGGVMFIDEAYELGHDSGDDHYSKECIDTINRNLSEHRDLLVIVAGYAEDLEECFFKHNAGLQRRFVFRYDINGYTSKELLEIFKLKVRNDEWSIDCADKVLEDFFKKNHKVFTNFGGDIETFLLNCKIEHSKRVLFEGSKKVLNLVDIKNGLSTFTKYRKPDASKSVGDALCELLNIKPKSDNKITHTIYTKA